MRPRHVAILSILFGLATAPAMAVDRNSRYNLNDDDAIALVNITSMDDRPGSAP